MKRRRREEIAFLYLRYAVGNEMLPRGLWFTISEISVAIDSSVSDVECFLDTLRSSSVKSSDDGSNMGLVVFVQEETVRRKQEEMAFACLKYFCALRYFPFHVNIAFFAKSADAIGVPLSEFFKFWKILGHELVEETFRMSDGF